MANFPAPVQSPQMQNAFSGDIGYDPMAALMNAYSVAGAMDRRDESRMRTKIDKMRLEEMMRTRQQEEGLLQAGENLLQAPSPQGRITPGPQQQKMMQNMFAPGSAMGQVAPGGYQPSAIPTTTDPTFPTELGPMKKSELLNLPQTTRDRLMVNQARTSNTLNMEAKAKKIADAQKRVQDLVVAGNDLAYQSYMRFMKSDPDLAPIAERLGDVKLAGEGKFKTQKYFSATELKKYDPLGKLSNGVPGYYDMEYKGPNEIDLKKSGMTTNKLVEVSQNGRTPEERDWAINQLAGIKERQPHTSYMDFFRGRMEELTKENSKRSEFSKAAQIQKEFKAQDDAFKLELYGNKEQKKKQTYEPEVNNITKGVESGLLPPILTGLSRSAITPLILSKFAEDGYAFKDAVQDWTAVVAHTKTMQGPQQVRLRNQVNNAYESIPVIRNLAKNWNDSSIVDTAGIPVIFNKANVWAAAQGLYGKKAKSASTQLVSELTEMQEVLGTVYMGGNSPTDKSLDLAKKLLNENWDFDTLNDNLNLLQTNLKIRNNSYKTSAPLSRGREIKPEGAEKEKPKIATQKQIHETAAANKMTDEAVTKILKENGFEIKD